VSEPAGFVSEPAGVVRAPAGFVGEPAGFVSEPAGFVSEPTGFAHQAGRRNSLAAGTGVRAANPDAKVGDFACGADDFARRPVTLAQRSHD
jgi:hypothetical protein